MNMIEDDLLLAVSLRKRGWSRPLKVRVVSRADSCRPHEVCVRLNLKVPRSLFYPSPIRVKAEITEEAAAAFAAASLEKTL